VQTNRPRGRSRRPAATPGDTPPGRPPKENPRVGDYRPQTPETWGELYCVYKMYGADGALLYVGETADIVRRMTEHQLGSRNSWGRRRPNRQSWWAEVCSVEIEHLPPGTTAWEAKVYERTQIAGGTRYNLDHNLQANRAVLARIAAEDRDVQRRNRAREEHELHDGTTRQVLPERVASPPAPLGPVSTSDPTDPSPARSVPSLVPPPLRRHERVTPPARAPRRAAAPPVRHNVDELEPDRGAVAAGERPINPETVAQDRSRSREHSLDPLNHQGRYALLLLLGIFIGIMLLFVWQVVL
jgi:GIY-YIG catalytic domain